MAASPYRGYVGYGGMTDALLGKKKRDPAMAYAEGMNGALPDLSGLETDAASTRKIADLLTDRAMGRNSTNIVSGLSQLGEALLARNAIKKADKAEKGLYAADDERRSAMTEALIGSGGLSPQQEQLLKMGAPGAAQALTERAFATPSDPKYGLDIKEVIGPDGKPMLVQASEAGGVRAIDGYAPAPETQGPMSTIGKLRADLDAGRITQAQFDQAVAGKPMVQVYTGSGQAVQSLADVPIGQPIPEGLLPADLLEKGQVAVRADNPYGFEVVNAPGSSAAMEAAAAQTKEEKNLGGTALTVGSLINSYSTLAKNKAITARGNTAADNVAALYSGTGLGQLQDQVGGDVGNLENAEARKNIEGLSMNALMKMISMSDVSAKAMDSDAEMKAWLSAIKSDNYESALTKLHVLDKSFGDGMALQKAYEAGTIDLPTYQYITNRVNTDPYTKQMADKAARYAALGGAVGTNNLTASEGESINDLLEFMTPEERALFESAQ